ncbi:hypothetical protein EU538_04875 [Candidatus Thorarchaeota archaeon]|jgi:hypothetical protein|nr:MAG: hypothetical protein EU538_04875 [Candidatus Thorarchaeota archaeon]
MNEYAILIRMLTRTGNPIGAGIPDLLDALGLPEEAGRHVLFQKMGALQHQLRPIGLEVRHNPLDHVFYLDTAAKTEDSLEETPLPDRLAATLLVIITLAYQEGGWVSVDRIQKFRKKSRRGVRADLRELDSMGYAEISDDKKRVRPGHRVGFEIDYESFFRNLSQSDET